MFWKNKQQPKNSKNPIELEAEKIMGPLPEDQSPHLPFDEDDQTIENGQKNNNLSDEAESNNVPESNKGAVVNNLDNEINDTKTDEAVKDIISHEADEILDNQDKLTTKSIPKIKSKNKLQKLWYNKKFRRIFVISLIVIVVLVLLVPSSRYMALNAFGARASASFKIIDIKNGRPVKNAKVTLSGQSIESNEEGLVKLQKIRLGRSTLSIEKRSFATLKQDITIGWGSNPFNSPFSLTPVGTKFDFVFLDKLSHRPIENAEITDGDSVAISNSEGGAELTIEPQSEDFILTAKAITYRTENIEITTNDRQQKQIYMVPTKPNVFVSKRSGKYDLYKKDIDGKNETVIFAGTGNENENFSLLVHPTENIAAFSSSREGKHNKEGYLLSNIYIVNIEDKIANKVPNSESESIKLLSWDGDKIIFTKSVSGPSGYLNSRQKILTYEYKQEKMTELATANYFNDIAVFGSQIFYAINNSNQLTKISSDGTAKKTILSKETWTIFRTSYNKIILSVINNNWYEFGLDSQIISTLEGIPASYSHRKYVESPKGSMAAYVEKRDGKGVLIVYDKDKQKETIVTDKSGLTYPLRWLSDKHLVYRISSYQETGDYAINIEAGRPMKIADITSAGSSNYWGY